MATRQEELAVAVWVLNGCQATALRKRRFVFAPLEELGRRMPQEAHLDAFGDAAGMRPDPGFVRVEDDPDLAGPIAGFSAGRAAFV